MNMTDKSELDMFFDPDAKLMSDVMNEVCRIKNIEAGTVRLVFNGKKCDLFRRIKEYSGKNGTIKLWVQPRLKGGAKIPDKEKRSGLKKVKVDTCKKDFISKSSQVPGDFTKIPCVSKLDAEIKEFFKIADASAIEALLMQAKKLDEAAIHECMVALSTVGPTTEKKIELCAYSFFGPNIKEAVTIKTGMDAIVESCVPVLGVQLRMLPELPVIDRLA